MGAFYKWLLIIIIIIIIIIISIRHIQVVDHSWEYCSNVHSTEQTIFGHMPFSDVTHPVSWGVF